MYKVLERSSEGLHKHEAASASLVSGSASLEDVPLY